MGWDVQWLPLGQSINKALSQHIQEVSIEPLGSTPHLSPYLDWKLHLEDAFHCSHFLGQKQGEQLSQGCGRSCHTEGTGTELPAPLCTHSAHPATSHSGIFPVSPGKVTSHSFECKRPHLSSGTGLLLAEGTYFLPLSSSFWFHHCISLSMTRNTSNLLITSHCEGPSRFRL